MSNEVAKLRRPWRPDRWNPFILIRDALHGYKGADEDLINPDNLAIPEPHHVTLIEAGANAMLEALTAQTVKWLDKHLFGDNPKEDTKCILFFHAWNELRQSIIDGKFD